MSGSSGRRTAIGAGAAMALLAGTGAALAASTNFTEPATSPVATGLGPVGVVATDLDGDGDRDLATANVTGGNVTVLKNTGTGVFHEPASSPEDAGSFPDFITSADIDGDLDRDLIVSNQESDDLTILKNNGNGNFIEPVTSPEPAGDVPASVAATDLDGDADVDLAIANAIENNSPSDVTILLNRGTGNFVAATTSPENAGNKPVSVAAADLDGDGDADLATADQQSSTVTVFRNNGSANFSHAPGSPEFAGTFPQAIVATDVGGNAATDVAVANQGSEDVTILRNNGFANFTEPVTSPEPVGGRPLSLAAADFDGDSDQDLAVPNNNDGNVTILRNDGLLDFVEPATSPEAAGPQPRQIAAGDLDGDADPDLAVVNQNGSSVTILRNR
jgi:hypothetical protein